MRSPLPKNAKGDTVSESVVYTVLLLGVLTVVAGVARFWVGEAFEHTEKPESRAVFIVVESGGVDHSILVSAAASTPSIMDAAACAVGHTGHPEASLIDSHGKSLARYGRAILRPGGRYTMGMADSALQTKGVQRNCSLAPLPTRGAARVPRQTATEVAPRLPRVIVATVATGRTRAAGIDALMSAFQHFGGDCIPSFHLLTDDVADIAAVLNPMEVRQHERVVGDRLVYDDLLHHFGNESAFSRSDYFFYLDPTAKFETPVRLQDVAGDLVAVEHAFYPRDHSGLCVPRARNGRLQSVHDQICEYPYSRNAESLAYVPPTVGKFWHKGQKKHHDGHNQVHLVVTSTYFHNLFWGGRTKFATQLVAELTVAVWKDMQRGLSGVTSEM